MTIKQIGYETDEFKTEVTLTSWPFNRDDLIAEMIVQACQDERERCPDEYHPVGWEDLDAFWSSFPEKVAALEGLAQAWLNRWESSHADENWIEIWGEMCDLLKEIGPSLWD